VASRLERRVASEGGPGVIEGAGSLFEVVDVLLAEVLDRGHDGAGRTVAQGAEGAAEDVVADVQELVDVGLGALATFQTVQDLDHPVVALARSEERRVGKRWR